MVRKLLLTMVVLAAASACNLGPVAAGPVSLNNPYRSFNISGVNYGSMKWQREHGAGRAQMKVIHRRGLFWRRR